MQLILATRNVHKIREYKAILKSLPRLDVLSLLDFPNYEPPAEDGTTFEENATIKALHAAEALKAWVLADDSGLVVPALGGQPGVYSARYSGEGATDTENRKKLLREMEGIEDRKRQAFFECWIALASPEGSLKLVSGICEGTLLREERGNNGFGYDPIFVKHEYSKTFAEMEETTKNRVSHRRKAVDKVLTFIETIDTQCYT